MHYFAIKKYKKLQNFHRIKHLFAYGESFLLYPFSIKFVVNNHSDNLSYLLLCPKRYLKKATQRTRTKRLMREAFRLNASNLQEFVSTNNLSLDCSITYICYKVLSFEQINNNMKEVLNILRLKYTDKIKENL